MDACVELLENVHAADGYPMRWPADPARWLSPERMRTAWVAEEGGGAGAVGHVVVVDDEEPAETAELSRLFVSPAMRGRGVGSLLIDAVVADATERGRRLWLHVIEGRGAAARLYESYGWRLVDRSQANWLTPAGEHPVLLRYELDPT